MYKVLKFSNGKYESDVISHEKNEMIYFSLKKDLKKLNVKLFRRKVKYKNGKPYFHFLGKDYDL